MKRAIFYLFYDPQGRVDDYVTHKLRALRPHAEEIFVVVNGTIEDESRAKLSEVADTIWERDNVGFDVWGYKTAMERFGFDALNQFDEIILMNYTFFGPIGSFDPLFERMDAKPELDFWGITNHGAVNPHPYHPGEIMPMHIQSHWISVRKSLFSTGDFREYWETMPMITSYEQSIDMHESRFTKHFSELGYTFEVAWDEKDYDNYHPVFDDIVLMLEQDLPIVKRRTFFHDPLYLDNRGIIGKDLEDAIIESGYPIEYVYQNLVRTSEPRNLATNLAHIEILPEQDLGYDREHALRTVAVAHIYYEEMVDEMVDCLDNIPGDYDLVVTTTTEPKAVAIRAALANRGRSGDVRVVESNRGRAESAFFIGCRDIILSDDYDLIVKIHSKKSPQVGARVGALFKRHLFDNLLGSPGYTANVFKLFQDHKGLGMVFPPIIHMGHPTMGRAWFANKKPAKIEADRLGITVPFDDSTPLAPYGTMLIARPAALRRIANGGYTYDDFPPDDEWGDGNLPHILERLMGYAALTDGFHIRQTLNLRWAAIDYGYLEYRTQATSKYLPGYAIYQIPVLKHYNELYREEPTLKIIKDRVGRRFPGLVKIARPFYRGARKLYRTVRPNRNPVAGHEDEFL